MLRRALTAAVMLCAALPLGGCGSLNTLLSSSVADILPHWAGGLPPGLPPRPNDPGYAEFVRAQQAKSINPAPQAETVGAGPAEAVTRPQPAVQSAQPIY